MRVVHNHPSFSTLALALAVYADHVRSFVRLIPPFDSSRARSASRPVPASHLVAMSLFTRALARGCASTPSTSACARSRARVAAFHGGLFAPSRARIPRDARAVHHRSTSVGGTRRRVRSPRRPHPHAPRFVASMAVSGEVLVFDLAASTKRYDKKAGPSSRLAGHQKEGWGLAWHPRSSAQLANFGVCRGCPWGRSQPNESSLPPCTCADGAGAA